MRLLSCLRARRRLVTQPPASAHASAATRTAPACSRPRARARRCLRRRCSSWFCARASYSVGTLLSPEPIAWLVRVSVTKSRPPIMLPPSAMTKSSAMSPAPKSASRDADFLLQTLGGVCERFADELRSARHRPSAAWSASGSTHARRSGSPPRRARLEAVRGPAAAGRPE